MLWVVLTMLSILVLAGVVATYVAFPRRGAATPAVPWLGGALDRAVEALPTLHNVGDRRAHEGR
ncbi:MAG TPA: hypothetical protein VFG72_01710 [Marmoricola sp.]|nr:hypothetical protein [Marmoricola sp.]